MYLFIYFCFTDNPSGQTLEEKIIYGVENSSTFLECSPKSQRAIVYWQFQKQNDDHKVEVQWKKLRDVTSLLHEDVLESQSFPE